MGTQVTKYYHAGTQRIATLAPHASAGVRKNNTLHFILGDHLGSTFLVTSTSGLVVSQTHPADLGLLTTCLKKF